MTHDECYSRAAFYALYLVQSGYEPDEAAELVMRRYPATRAVLARWTEPRSADPLIDRLEPRAKEGRP